MKKTFYISGIRPIYVEEPDGLVYIYCYNWNNGLFEEDMSYFPKLFIESSVDIEEVSEDKFWNYVGELRKKIKSKES
jgi:hypothetical protein